MLKLVRKIKKYGFRDVRTIINYILHQEEYDFIAEQLEEFYRNEMQNNI